LPLPSFAIVTVGEDGRKSAPLEAPADQVSTLHAAFRSEWAQGNVRPEGKCADAIRRIRAALRANALVDPTPAADDDGSGASAATPASSSAAKFAHESGQSKKSVENVIPAAEETMRRIRIRFSKGAELDLDASKLIALRIIVDPRAPPLHPSEVTGVRHGDGILLHGGEAAIAQLGQEEKPTWYAVRAGRSEPSLIEFAELQRGRYDFVQRSRASAHERSSLTVELALVRASASHAQRPREIEATEREYTFVDVIREEVCGVRSDGTMKSPPCPAAPTPTTGGRSQDCYASVSRRKSVQREGRRARAHEARAVEEERLRHRALAARAPSMACAGGDGGGSSPATAPAAQGAGATVTTDVGDGGGGAATHDADTVMAEGGTATATEGGKRGRGGGAEAGGGGAAEAAYAAHGAAAAGGGEGQGPKKKKKKNKGKSKGKKHKRRR